MIIQRLKNLWKLSEYELRTQPNKDDLVLYKNIVTIKKEPAMIFYEKSNQLEESIIEENEGNTI